jgi:hypothetical protein
MHASGSESMVHEHLHLHALLALSQIHAQQQVAIHHTQTNPSTALHVMMEQLHIPSCGYSSCFKEHHTLEPVDVPTSHGVPRQSLPPFQLVQPGSLVIESVFRVGTKTGIRTQGRCRECWRFVWHSNMASVGLDIHVRIVETGAEASPTCSCHSSSGSQRMVPPLLKRPDGPWRS